MKRIVIGIIDRLFVALLAAAIALAVLAVVRPWERPLVLDAHTPIVMRWETPDGTEVLPPKTVELWEFVQIPDRNNANALLDFQGAFEHDLHAHDLTFHFAHENIDEKQW